MASSDDHAGWEPIWRSGEDNIPPRYRTFAAPNETVVEWAAELPAGASILDVGCGVGRHAIYLGGCGFQMAGVDISPTGIRMAQDACAARQLPFDGKVSDMTIMPWPDATFDGALSTSTIHHHRRADIARALAEVRRVLKPGGMFLADFPSTSTRMYQRLRDQVAAGEIVEVEPNTFVDERPDSDDADGMLPHHFCNEADLRDLLRDFEIVRLWADLKEIAPEAGAGLMGKWVVWVRRPITG
jgi:tellurite methyltransferase